MRKKKNPKRAIDIVFKDGTRKTLQLVKATSVNTSSEMLHLDQLGNGGWRLIWNENLIPDFTKVDRLEIIREE